MASQNTGNTTACLTVCGQQQQKQVRITGLWDENPLVNSPRIHVFISMPYKVLFICTVVAIWL